MYPSASQAPNEMLFYNFDVLCRAIDTYKSSNDGNSPLCLTSLVEKKIIDSMPINPISKLPMSNVSLYSNYKRGNYTYLTYSERHRVSPNIHFKNVTEHLFIIYHDGNYPPNCEGAFGNILLDSISKEVLYTDGQIMSGNRVGVYRIWPDIAEILDINGYFNSDVLNVSETSMESGEVH